MHGKRWDSQFMLEIWGGKTEESSLKSEIKEKIE